MAREKRPARKAASPLADASRDTTFAQRERTVKDNSTEQRETLVNYSVPGETPIAVDFTSHTIDEVKHKSKRQRDLEGALRIITRRHNGQSVTWSELEWATTLCAKEAKLEQAELAETAANESKKQQWKEDQEQRIREIKAANKDPAWTERMLNRVLTGEGDKSDSESDSDLSSVATDISALDPDRIPQQVAVNDNVTAVREPGDDENGRNDLTEDAVAPGGIEPQLSTSISHAIATLTYDDNPPDRPNWLTGLSKPLPHPSLTTLQDHEVTTRFWDSEIARLTNLRDSLPVPHDQPSNGEWMYEHFGSTIEVLKKSITGGGKKEATFARGKWTYVVDEENVEVRLDEYPLGLDGQPLGWGTHELEDWDREIELRDKGVPDENEDEDGKEEVEKELLSVAGGKKQAEVGLAEMDAGELEEEEVEEVLSVPAGRKTNEVGLDERAAGESEGGGQPGSEAGRASDANSGMSASKDEMELEALGESIFDDDIWEAFIGINDEQ